MITLNQNEFKTIHAMQNGLELTKQDLLFLDVAATKILANAKSLRNKFGIKHPCDTFHTNINIGDKLKDFLAEPKTENELFVFLRAKTKKSMHGIISNARLRYKLCFCKVSHSHYQYLPQYDDIEGGPTSFSHFIAIQMLLSEGRLKHGYLSAKFGVPKSKIENVLKLGRRHKKRFSVFLKKVDEHREKTQSNPFG